MSVEPVVRSSDVKASGRRGLELRKPPVIVVGGLPSVSLLPGELRDAARGRSIRRALVGAVVVAVLLAGGATAGATVLAGSAQTRLDAAGAESNALVGQLAKFKDVQALQHDVVLGRAAVQVGSSAEIDWQTQLDAIEADMPSNYAVASVVGDSANVIQDYPQGSTPLEMPRAATLTLNVEAPNITKLPIWLRKLRSIPAYADATASASASDRTGYEVTVVVHLSPKALENRKAAK